MKRIQVGDVVKLRKKYRKGLLTTEMFLLTHNKLTVTAVCLRKGIVDNIDIIGAGGPSPNATWTVPAYMMKRVRPSFFRWLLFWK